MSYIFVVVLQLTNYTSSLIVCCLYSMSISEKVLYGRKELYMPAREGFALPLLHPETSGLVQQDLAKLASFLNGSGIKWFLAGGTSLDLARGNHHYDHRDPDIAVLYERFPTFITGGTSFDRGGTITRDHTDFDIALFRRDIPAFFTYAQSAGYRFETLVTSEEITTYRKKFGDEPHIRRWEKEGEIAIIDFALEQEFQNSDSPFALPTKKNVPFMDLIDLDIMEESDTGDVFFDRQHYPMLTIPSSSYDDPQTYKAINGELVPLQPHPVIIMHKLISARLKDFMDIQAAAL